MADWSCCYCAINPWVLRPSSSPLHFILLRRCLSPRLEGPLAFTLPPFVLIVSARDQAGQITGIESAHPPPAFVDPARAFDLGDAVTGQEAFVAAGQFAGGMVPVEEEGADEHESGVEDVEESFMVQKVTRRLAVRR